MYIEQTVAMARNRVPTYRERGDMMDYSYRLYEFTNGQYSVWFHGYCSSYPVSELTDDLDEARKVFDEKIERGHWHIYTPEDIRTYKRKLWAS